MAPEIISAIIGAGASTANNAANIAHQVAENQKDRNFNAEQASLNRDFQSKEAELAYERQLDYYNTTQSPEAMVKQYQAAGLNPAMLAGGVSGSSAPISAPSGSSASSHGSPLPQMTNILSDAMNLETMKATIEEIRSRTNKNEAETQSIEKATSWMDIMKSTEVDSMKAGIDKIRSDISVNEQSVEESIQRVKESVKKVEHYESEIEVNGALVDLHGSQQVLNESKAIVEKLNAATLQKMLPYIEKRQEAEIALTEAKTEEAKYSAESLMYEANLKMLKMLVDQKLIDSSYYDSVVDQAHWDAKMKKREYKWKPINDICYNVSMLAIGAGSVMSGAGSLVTGGAAAMNAATNAAPHMVVKGFK